MWLTVTPNLSGNSASKRATSWERPTPDAADSTTRRGGARCGLDRRTRQQLAIAGRPCTHTQRSMPQGDGELSGLCAMREASVNTCFTAAVLCSAVGSCEP